MRQFLADVWLLVRWFLAEFWPGILAFLAAVLGCPWLIRLYVDYLIWVMK